MHELAKELGMTNAETVELCHSLGVPIKGQSSSLNEAYADMVRRKAEREGLTRDEQPQEAPAESGGSKAKKAGSTIRIHALAKELQMTNPELVAFCQSLDLAVKGHSSTLNEDDAAMVREKAQQAGLTGSTASAPAPAAAPAADEPLVVAEAEPAEQPASEPESASVEESVDETPDSTPEADGGSSDEAPTPEPPADPAPRVISSAGPGSQPDRVVSSPGPESAKAAPPTESDRPSSSASPRPTPPVGASGR
ncbi:MAG: translation initiation factor IF-2 N-terminal domain-containing protein, partial [Ilumatobacteraceae bacterium]